MLVTQIVNKRNEGPTTTAFYAKTTTVVSGDLDDLGRRETEGQSNATTKPKIADIRVKRTTESRQPLSACFSNGTIAPCSIILFHATVHADSLGPTIKSLSPNNSLNTTNLSSKIPSSMSAFSITQSAASSRLITPSLNFITSTNPSYSTLASSLNSANTKSFLAESTFLNNDASHHTSYIRSLRSANAESLSTTNSALSATAHFSSSITSSNHTLFMSSSVAHVKISLTATTVSSLGSSEPTLLRNNSRPPGSSSPMSANDILPLASTSHTSSSNTSLSQIVSTAYSSNFLTYIRFSSQTESILSPAAKTSLISHDTFISLIPRVSPALVTSQASASTTGIVEAVEAAYSATAISSGVAEASGYAMLLKLDPSDKSKARAAQKSTHDSLKCTLSQS